ncbi:MAG TPA: hypothetical protein VLZ06_05830 [Solirubrobacteraceae bacterium]|nr:hypothetical protein [Solirubrobacteraceae bacterium]
MEEQPASPAWPEERPGFIARGRIRRRVRFLRKARELAYRDLGGLVYNLHRFGQRNDALVLAKLTTLGHIDSELRALERQLREAQPLTVLSEAGITACARCAAIHSSEDRFCPNCGLPLHRHADLPADLRAGTTPTAAEAAPTAAPPVAVGPSPGGPGAPVPPSPARGDAHASQTTSSYESVAPPVRAPQQPPSPGPAPVTPAAATPPEATPPKETPPEATPPEDTPAGGTPSEGTPAGGTPSGGTPARATAPDAPPPGVPPGGEQGDDEATAIIRPPANRQ